MPHLAKTAVVRHEYLLSRFKASPLPNSDKVEFRFEGNLPRAKTLRLAIDAAIVEAGGVVPERVGVEITDQHAKQIDYLLKLFVKAAPATEVAADDPKYTDVIYSYGFTTSYRAKAGSTIQEVMDSVCRFEPPAAIAGLRTSEDQLYELLHVALRKGCDSKITSAAWHAMHVIDGPDRQWLVDTVQTALTSAPHTTAEQVVGAVRKALLEGDSHGETSGRRLMHGLFRVFEDDDWMGMLSYCIIWPYEVAPKPEVALPVEPAASQVTT